MSITLFISTPAAEHFEAVLRRRWPALEMLLVRASPQIAADSNTILAKLFGLTAGFGTAPFMRLADTGKRDTGFYFRADPVHLAPDRDQLVMLPLSVMQVQREEATALAETFNHSYAAEGYRLETPQPDRWYLRFPEPLNSLTRTPSEVAGQPVFDFMPAGEDGLKLRQFMNEVQMLFHEHPVNQAREAAGKPAINSLWFWGGGRLPEAPSKGPERVLTDMPLVAGLAQFSDSECAAWPDNSGIVPGPVEQLIAVNCSTETEWERAEAQAAVPLLQALRHGRIGELIIYPGNQRAYRVTPSLLRRFWRRRRPLADILCVP